MGEIQATEGRMKPTRDKAKGKWAAILEREGLGDSLTGKHGPCPVTQDGTDRFRWKADSERYYCHCTNGSSGDGFDLLQCKHGCDFATAARIADEALGEDLPTSKPKPKRDPKIRLKRTWAATKANGAVVYRYLQSRGIDPVLATRQATLSYYDNGTDIGQFPCMVAQIHDSQGPVSLHITYLTRDGKKADVPSVKKVLPALRKMSGNYWIPLLTGGDQVYVGEGIETALSAVPLFGAQSVVAMSSDHGMSTYRAEGFTSVKILADPDYAGLAAAYTLAHRLQSTHDVDVLVPSDGDWNDVLRRREQAA